MRLTSNLFYTKIYLLAIEKVSRSILYGNLYSPYDMGHMVKVSIHILSVFRKSKTEQIVRKVVTADSYRLVVGLNTTSAGMKINPSSTLLKSSESDEPLL